MTNYPESGIKLVVDSDQYTKDMDAAIFLADYFDSLGDLTISVAAEVDTASFDVELPQDGETIDIEIDATVEGVEDLPLDGENVDFTVEATIEGDLEDLPLDGDTVNFTADGTVTGDVEDIPKDGETIETQLNVEETDTAKQTLDAVNTIKDLETLKTVWNITGNAVDLIGKFASFAVDPLLAVDDAVARINAETGNAIPNVDKLVSGIHDSDLGDSFDQISDVVIQAQQIGAPIEEATNAALKFTKVFKDQNPKDVLNAMNQLVGSGLVDSFEEAGDLLTTAFQNGGNRAGDLLDTVNKNATAFKDMGLDGKESLGLITQGLDAGFKSANDVAGSVTKIKQNVTNAAGNETSDVTKTLNMLGIANPADTGEAWSKDFIANVIKGIQSAPVSDTEKQTMLSNLLGGKLGAKEFSSFMKLSPEDAADIFVNMKGAADTAATEIDNSLHGAIDDFMLAAQVAATKFLSSEQIDLPGKIEKLKTGLQDALNVLGEGGSLGEALTIALKPIGFDDEFQKLESALGNFVIGILQAVAQLQDITGHGKEAAGTRATIAGMAKQQLEFDLKIGNPDDVSQTIATAASRGLSDSDILKTVSGTVDSMIKDGALSAARDLTDSLAAQPPMQLQLMAGLDENTKGLVAQQLEAFGFGTLNSDGTITMNITPDMNPVAIEGLANTIIDTVTGNFNSTVIEGVKVDPVLGEGAISEIQGQIDDAVKNIKTDADKKTQQARLDVADAAEEVNSPTLVLKQTATDTATAVASVDTQMNKASDTAAKQAQATADVASAATDAKEPIDEIAISFYTAGDNADKLNTSLTGTNTAIQNIINTAGSLATSAASVAKKQGELDNQSAASVPDAKPAKHAAGTRSDTGTFMTGESGRELVTTDQNLAVLNNATTEKIMAAMNSYLPGGSFRGGGGSTNIITNNNNIPNVAVADRLGYSQAATLRGAN